MKIQRQITTAKQKARKQKKAERRQSKRNRFQIWHSRFVIYKCIKDWENNSKTHVWFETVERKGRCYSALESSFGLQWSWSYRLPQNATDEARKTNER